MSYEAVKKVMMSDGLPPGQMFLYKALLENGQMTIPELAELTDRNVRQVGSTLGGLGRRVQRAGCKPLDGSPPARIMIDRDRDGYYSLTPEVEQFIVDTPDFEHTLRETDMVRFYIKTKMADSFYFNEDGTGGQLREFTRKPSWLK